MPRYFTVESAGRLLATLAAPLEQAASLKQKLEDIERELRAASDRLSMLGGALPDRAQLVASIGRRDALATRLNEIIASVQQHGCLVKDLERGLVDFPTLFRGEEVYLCWKLGELAIEYWHRVEDGFRGRKRIDQEFLQNHHAEESG